MPRRLALMLIPLALIAGCSDQQPPAPTTTTASLGPARPPAPIVLTACDDGGSGGVIIDGVCL